MKYKNFLLRAVNLLLILGVLWQYQQVALIRAAAVSPVSYTHLDVYKRQLYAFLHHRCHSPHSRKHPLLLHERSRLQ